MLIQRFINTLPNRKDRILKASMNFLSEMNDRKESEEGRIFQNKCVSSQNKQYEKRRGRHGRLSAILSPTFSHSGQLRAGRTGSVLHGNIQLYRKAP